MEQYTSTPSKRNIPELTIHLSPMKQLDFVLVPTESNTDDSSICHTHFEFDNELSLDSTFEVSKQNISTDENIHHIVESKSPGTILPLGSNNLRSNLPLPKRFSCCTYFEGTFIIKYHQRMDFL